MRVMHLLNGKLDFALCNGMQMGDQTRYYSGMTPRLRITDYVICSHVIQAHIAYIQLVPPLARSNSQE